MKTADPGTRRVILTARLIMQPHDIADHPDCAVMWSDPGVVRYIGTGSPLSGEEVWNRLLRYAGCWTLFGYGYWAVRERESGRFVGDVGLQRLRRAARPELPDRPEMGWVLAVAAHGQGYAREAVAAALAWADREVADADTFCIIRPQHQRSIRVAEQAGYARTGSVLLGNEPIDVLVRPRGDGSVLAVSHLDDPPAIPQVSGLPRGAPPRG